jgi:hypothetical protein
MVHALREARRVVSPNGYLLDLRPAPVHRRVSIEQGGLRRQLGIMRETFDDDYAANRAVVAIVDAGLLKLLGRVRFGCVRKMDRLSEFQAWLDEFMTLGRMPSHEWLVQRVSQALEMSRAVKARVGRARIVVTGPVDLRVLQKR